MAKNVSKNKVIKYVIETDQLQQKCDTRWNKNLALKQSKEINQINTINQNVTIWNIWVLNINVFLIKQTIGLNWFLAMPQKDQKF